EQSSEELRRSMCRKHRFNSTWYLQMMIILESCRDKNPVIRRNSLATLSEVLYSLDLKTDTGKRRLAIINEICFAQVFPRLRNSNNLQSFEKVLKEIDSLSLLMVRTFQMEEIPFRSIEYLQSFKNEFSGRNLP